MDTPYQYQSLDKSSPQFRLVTLLPSSDSTAPVSVKVNTEAFPSTQKYEALSYAWGGPSNGYFIYEEKSTIEVGENLYQALIHLRYADKSRTLWIDALCINQKDDEEKNHQVQCMRDIYSGAEEVIVWLGPSDEDLDSAVAYIHTFYEFRDMKNQPIAGFKKLYRNPWWTRMWVVQEVCLAKEHPIFHVGHHELDWWDTVDDILAGICRDDLNREIPLRILEDPISLRGFHELRDDTEEELPPFSLAKLLYTTANRRATVPHDHVYALLGIVADDLTDLKIDYSLPVSSVFKDTMVLILKNQQDLSWLFYAVKYYPREQTKASLPSWCIDFSDPNWVHDANRKGWSILDDDGAREGPVHGASTGRDMTPMVYDKFAGIIQVTGTRVGRIKYSQMATTEAFSTYNNSEKMLKDLELRKFVEMSLKKVFDDIGQFIKHSDRAWARRLDGNGSIIGYVECIFNVFSTGLDTSGNMTIFELLPIISKEADLELLQKSASRLNTIKSAIKHDWTELIHRAHELEEYVLFSYLDMADSTAGKCYFTTDSGYSGVAGHAVEEGDVLCILFGSKYPAVLRPQSDGKFTLVTFTYTLDIMKGELLADSNSVIDEVFTLR